MRNVLVTGGSRGLGLAIASRLAADGYRVVAVARSRGEALHQASEQAKAGPGSVEFHPADLADVEGIAGLVRGVKADYGPIWGLVNNAGLGTGGLLANMGHLQIEALIRLNTTSPILMTKYVVRHMMSAGEGRIVNMSSIVASTGFNGLSVYAATKASLVGFTRSLAREVGRVGVTVNAVAPGFINTEMTSDMGDADLDRVVRRSPFKRLADPADVAGAVAYLMSDEARNITGTVLTVDAGATA